MTLREKQCIFARCLAWLILWIDEHGWAVSLSEGYVGETDAADGDYDGPHKCGGMHYTKLAQDLNLFVDGLLCRDGEHPAWQAIGKHWKTLHPSARWGGDWGDANHVSFEHEGRA